MNNKIIRLCFIGLISFVLASLTTGCNYIKEDQSHCVWDALQIRVVTEAIPGTPKPNDDEVKRVSLYLFDENEQLIDIIRGIKINQVVEINYPNPERLHIVAKSNYLDENEIINKSTLSQSSIELTKSNLYDDKQTYNAPQDLFLGKIEIDNKNRPFTVQELPIQRIVSSINIKAKGLHDFAKGLLSLNEVPKDEDFKFVVRNSYTNVDFTRTPAGDEAHYSSGGATDATGKVFEVPTHNMFSSVSGEDVTIYIYYKGTLIDTVTEGLPETENSPYEKLIAENGKLLQVRITYMGDVHTVIQKSGWWNKVDVWVEWQE